MAPHVLVYRPHIGPINELPNLIKSFRELLEDHNIQCYHKFTLYYDEQPSNNESDVQVARSLYGFILDRDDEPRARELILKRFLVQWLEPCQVYMSRWQSDTPFAGVVSKMFKVKQFLKETENFENRSMSRMEIHYGKTGREGSRIDYLFAKGPCRIFDEPDRFLYPRWGIRSNRRKKKQKKVHF
ncbi:hypothetical protein M0812_16039 [Anaeramoeba flamelloides]|uniref:Uncharacterized protein n=1 Tax=Anaeramoeba flamelloides TaxID=1746091 RepID=A0AAV7ZE39_9EUKA|nr:hypothetical protein M0812_16039 [Anaeramoeba flamelloides]